MCPFAEAYQDKAEGCHEIPARITEPALKRKDQEINCKV